MRRKNNKESTFRFPFDIDTRYFLAFAFIFFVLSIKPINKFFYSKLSVKQLKEKIEFDVSTKIISFNQLCADTFFLKKACAQKLSKSASDKLLNLPYSIYFFKKDELLCWNSVLTRIPPVTFSSDLPSPYKDSNGYYIALQKNIQIANEPYHFVALIKIKNDNGIENDYFTKNFLVDDDENDFNLELSFTPKEKSIPIIVQNQTQFYIYKNDDFLTVNDKSGWRLFLSALPFILFGVSIHTYFKVSVNKKNTQKIYGMLLLTILLIRFMTYQWGFPNDFDEFGLFSPEFFASDYLNKSLGDVFINMCLLFWALLFFIINVQGKVYNLKANKYRKIIGTTISFICIIAALLLSDLIYRISRDSIINFDTTFFYKLDLYSFIGILNFMVIFVNIVYLSIISRNYLLVCFDAIYVKYILVVIVCFLLLLFKFDIDKGISFYFVFLLLMALYLLQDLNYLKIKFDFNSYKLLIWIMLISASGALLLTFLITDKELTLRENYAEELLSKDDTEINELWSDKLNRIEQDSTIQSMLSDASLAASKLKPYIIEKYFDVENSDYNISLQISTLATNHVKEIEPYIDSGNPNDPLHRIENTGYYLYKTIINSQSKPIYLTIRLLKKEGDIVNDYEDLLRSKKASDLLRNDLYSLAVYHNGFLRNPKGDNFFPYKLDTNSRKYKSGNMLITKEGGKSLLWLKNDAGNEEVLIIRSNTQLFLFTTLFAYIFFMYFVTVTLYILGNIIARSNLNYKRFVNLLSINLRLRIHFSILVVELLSFVVIGYSTSYFLINSNNERMKKELNKNSYNVQQEVINSQSVLSSNEFLNADSNGNNSANVQLMKTISDRFSVNINFYSIESGKLLYTSLPKLYKREILADRISPSIFQSIRHGNFNNRIYKEQIGLLEFFSSYFLVRDAQGSNVGVVQLPFFRSNSEKKSESTSIITTLINIYIFVFLISAIIAFFITKSVTRPFTYIVKQFTKINLSKTNEPLKWFDSDEIGLLIKEYNRMLRKLENSTVLLAKNEREMAWREMAKQVAHEIKNPLTPMKLSLQMLERSIKNNAPNLNEIATKVTKTSIEQIDNLTLIATNFSNFAKLPASKKEVFALNELLYSVTGMYHDDKQNEFLFMIPDYEIQLNTDKSQIMRVFTNIIQNAIQSIPEDRKGNIALTVSKIKNNQVRISISDNGEGISDEKSKSLFQPYFTTKTSGTGLGLAMCKDIIEESGGRISFESILDEGTIFHIDLPIYLHE